MKSNKNHANQPTQGTFVPRDNRDAMYLRMLQLKAKLPPSFSYTTVYQYFFGTLDEYGVDHLRKCWLLKRADEEVLKRFEFIADHKGVLPTDNPHK